ncbi:hypothetical protein ES705_21516 [subsurface metagenome]|jgi:hypothetical protein
MTITKKCELLAEDYLFLRDKVKDLERDVWRMESFEPPMERISTLANNFILTYLGTPGSEILYPNVPRETFRKAEDGIREALKKATAKDIRIHIGMVAADVEDEMWQKVVACECRR